MGVIMKTEKSKYQTSYEQYVKMGKRLLREIKCNQVQIAHYAVQVCDIRHGGRMVNGEYTMARYAADIGMNPKTLYEWVAVYRRVIAKLDKGIDKVTPKDWAVANRVNSLLQEEKKHVQKLNGQSGKKTSAYKQDISPARVKQLFSENYNGPSLQKEVCAWSDYILFVRNKLEKIDLTKVSDESILVLKSSLDEASSILLRHLVNKTNQHKPVAMVKPKTGLHNQIH
jgi:transposase-like protein